MKEKIIFCVIMEDKFDRQQIPIAGFKSRLKAEEAIRKLELAVDGYVENWVSYYVTTSDRCDLTIRPWRD